jgi:type II secretory pathway pseudopilin PulG
MLRPLARFRRTGITLIEGLVIVAIIVVLIALLMPATQSARQSSRRTARMNAEKEAMIAAATELAATPKIKAQFVNLQQPGDAPRRIIYEAEISLVVKDVTTVESQIAALLKEHQGYVAESSIDRTQGEELSGRWRVRIPVERFDSFLDAVAKLGVAESRKQTAQDVTEEFVDLEAQISNKKKLEERIVELVNNQSGEIKDVIEVERELGRVRGEIEQMEGRLRYLTNRAELTTVSIFAREVDDYVPPQAPSFANRIQRAWTDSLDSMATFGQQAVVALVYAFPWIIVLGVVLVPGLWYVRKRNSGR